MEMPNLNCSNFARKRVSNSIKKPYIDKLPFFLEVVSMCSPLVSNMAVDLHRDVTYSAVFASGK